MHFSTLTSTVLFAFIVTFTTVVVPNPSTLAAGRFAVVRGVRSAAIFLVGVLCLDSIVFWLLALGFQPVLHRMGASRLFQPLAGTMLCVAGILVLIAAPRQVERLIAERQRRDLGRTESLHGPFVAGIVVPAANPGFWVWWSTVGITFIHGAKQWGTPGVIVLFPAVIGGAAAWYVPLLVLLRRGRRDLNPGVLRRFLTLLGIVMVGFGVYLLWHFFLGGRL